MATPSSNAIQSTTSCLPFNPGPEFEDLQKKYGHVDRYLFRLFHKHSEAIKDRAWIKSRDAQLLRPSSNCDIFARYSRKDVAQALRRHLLKEVQPHEEDNFVSWSSSLLWLLHYACQTMRQAGVYSPKDTFICVVDKTRLPAHVFMSDLFLISAFAPHDVSTGDSSTSRRNLRYLQSQRQSKSKQPGHTGPYHSGEYLSQGALHVEGRCSTVSLADITDAGLYTLRRELSLPTRKSGIVARSLLQLREDFHKPSSRCPTKASEIEAALRIGEKYGPSWKLPMALAFLALKPRMEWDDAIMKACRQFHGKSRLPWP
jgi:hypothetical protein